MQFNLCPIKSVKDQLGLQILQSAYRFQGSSESNLIGEGDQFLRIGVLSSAIRSGPAACLDPTFATTCIWLLKVSVLLYHLFRVVAHILTDAENHREEDREVYTTRIRAACNTNVVHSCRHLQSSGGWGLPLHRCRRPGPRHRQAVESPEIEAALRSKPSRTG